VKSLKKILLMAVLLAAMIVIPAAAARSMPHVGGYAAVKQVNRAERT
jgi:hypothetical protein